MKPSQNQAPAILDLPSYVQNLMDALGFEKAGTKEQDAMYGELLEQASRRVLEAVISNADPESLDETMEMNGNTEKVSVFLEKWIERSPEAQLAAMDALTEFWNEMLSLKAA